MEIFIANLDKGIQEELLSKLFEAFGPVSKAAIAKDKVSGGSKGFGFVTMENTVEGESAITELNGRELAGKTLEVKKSIPKDRKYSQRVHERGNDYSNSEETEYKENISDKVIEEAEYSTKALEDGLVKISFKR